MEPRLRTVRSSLNRGVADLLHPATQPDGQAILQTAAEASGGPGARNAITPTTVERWRHVESRAVP